MTPATGLVLWTVLGLLTGSLVSWLAARLPFDRPLWRWPAHCHGKGEALALWQLVPVVGYLLQRGRCARCGAAIDARYPITEALCALSFGLIWARFSELASPATLLIGSFYAAVLWLVFLVDWRHHLILNRVTYPLILVALLLGFVYPRSTQPLALAGAVACGALFLGLYTLGRLLYRGRTPLGLGDVKLAILQGAMLGLSAGFVALVLGTLVGAAQALGALLIGRNRRAYMPYGTAMVVAAMIALLLGNEIWIWYFVRDWSMAVDEASRPR